MKSTQKQPANRPADPTITPAKVLRQAAIYLWRYGWTTDTFYDRTDGQDIPFPPACLDGAIRCAVFGQPVESLYPQILDPNHTRTAALITAVRTALADEVDPEWRCPTTDCTDRDMCALEVISDWNDFDGRSISQVLIALYAAADEWERLHPTPAPAPAVRS